MKLVLRTVVLIAFAALLLAGCVASKYAAERRLISRQEYAQAQDSLFHEGSLDAQAWSLIAVCRFHLQDYLGLLEASKLSLALSDSYRERVTHYVHEAYVILLTKALDDFYAGNDLDASKSLNQVLAFGQGITEDISPQIFKTNKRVTAIASAAALRLKNYPEAESYLNGLRSEWQDRPELLARLALTYYQMGNKQACIELCEQILLKQPQNEDVLRLRTQALRGSDRQEATLNAFRDELELSHGQPVLHRDMGILLFELGDWKQAAEHLQHAYETQDPDSLNLLVMLAECAFNDGEFHGALDHYRHALRIQPGNPDLYRAIGACHWNLGERTEAQAAFAQAMRSEAAAEDSAESDAAAAPTNGGGTSK